MCSILADRIGARLCTIGSAFHSGRHLAVAGDEPAKDLVVEAHVPRQGTFEFLLNAFAKATGAPDLWIDFQTSREAGEPPAWPEDLTMNIGESRPAASYEATFLPQRPHQQYDALVYVSKTSPITVLPGYYLYSRTKWGSTT
jgi:erythromycin esterase-like protein